MGMLIGLALSAVGAFAGDLRVMPVGDSLTAAPHYRRELLERAQTSGVRLAMVGPFADGARGGHAGVSGASIAQINATLASHLREHRPDIVLAMIGTNNMNHGLGMAGDQARGYPVDAQGRAIGAMVAAPLNGSFLDGLGALWGDKTYGSDYLAGEVEALMTTVIQSDPGIRLVISTIPPIAQGPPEAQVGNEHCDARITEYNAMIARIADRLNDRFGGRITVVDPHPAVRRGPGGPADSDFGAIEDQAQDWVHPKPWSDAWGTIAQLFLDAIIADVHKQGAR
jgi:hypothetical protein